MTAKVRTKKFVIGMTASVAGFILAALVFVFYFMHLVYEREERIRADRVPPPVRETFARMYPGTTRVAWKFDDEFYEAKFTWQGKPETEAYFSGDGAWSHTESVIDFDELPERARAYLDAQDTEIEDIERIESSGGPPTYEVQLGSGFAEWDCVFDEEGDLISRVRDGPSLE